MHQENQYQLTLNLELTKIRYILKMIKKVLMYISRLLKYQREKRDYYIQQIQMKQVNLDKLWKERHQEKVMMMNCDIL